MDAAAVSAVTGSVDFATVITGLGAVFGAMALVKVALAGGRKLLSSIR